MAKTLNTTVVAHKTKNTRSGFEVLDSRTFKVGEDVPSDWAKVITNPKVWDGEDDAPPPPAPQREAGTPPPLSGPGSDEESWRLYAAEVDVDVESAKTRGEVIDAIKAADKPTERQGA